LDVQPQKRFRPAQALPVKPVQRRAEGSVERLNELVRRVASDGDRSAYALLFSELAPRVKTYLMRSGASAEIAEDVVQETMLMVWRKASYFDASRASATTWIFTIARNLRIDGQRRKVNNQAVMPDMTEVASDEPTPEEQLLNASRDERVRRAMDSLSKEQEAIVRLSFFSEKPHGEIAQELGIPLGTVKSRVRLALARLRGLLEEAA
jgi:RNA polymerase sigma-70 factor (ECF subfamily)